ncbi:methylmalonyl Co-A mutase-associated GTPase MeaB [Acanthopleuribacter pedis]|uniref:Methylmalonyl Co-A mutase-associated GTPase MeaB n=1 Tax=Acanthopleuribacter pedis TaxID=442870 RepID=A0A8J7QDN8_9BACT|nr:methylmalonyl Co-A mutase-associated GTPase MeaB [Acanthopleuribacter pedis]MBO1319151.1 methylmalonyl Co-A mutase-associated GTPase MeaB [Acanthopleuribacter pedis]
MEQTANPISLDTATQRLAEGVLAGRRRALSKAITLVENTREDRRRQANQLVSYLLPRSGTATRIGISGTPGVGKSTFIEAFGLFLIERGLRVAVLAVDPSSKISGGSILGDKVRMEQLARRNEAFIRPSPSAGTLGGVTRRTRETMMLCEAAGFDVILIETVGVGQSETAVADMVDFFTVLLLPNAGDEIQGIKKGIIEVADLLVINKADGEFRDAAKRARRHYANAVNLFRPKNPHWKTPVVCASGLGGEGIDTVWESAGKHRALLEEHGLFEKLRRQQRQRWFQQALEDSLLERFQAHPEVARKLPELRNAIGQGQMSPHHAAANLIGLFMGDPQQN